MGFEIKNRRRKYNNYDNDSRGQLVLRALVRGEYKTRRLSTKP